MNLTALVPLPYRALALALLSAARLRFMARLKNWPNHGAGWANRMAGNLDYAAMDNEV